MEGGPPGPSWLPPLPFLLAHPTFLILHKELQLSLVTLSVGHLWVGLSSLKDLLEQEGGTGGTNLIPLLWLVHKGRVHSGRWV